MNVRNSILVMMGNGDVNETVQTELLTGSRLARRREQLERFKGDGVCSDLVAAEIRRQEFEDRSAEAELIRRRTRLAAYEQKKREFRARYAAHMLKKYGVTVDDWGDE
jgi:hypothetical protein